MSHLIFKEFVAYDQLLTYKKVFLKESLLLKKTKIVKQLHSEHGKKIK